MADQEKDKHLDDLLESLLSAYSVAEPRPGLETRILAQVRSAASERRPWVWNLGWLGAGAAVIIAILLLVYVSRPIAPHHRAPIEAVNPLPQAPQAVAGPTPAITARGRSQSPRRVVREAPEEMYTLAVQDRPAVFPTPVALSDQERLLLKYLAVTPKDEVIAQSHSDEAVDGFPDDQSALPATVKQPITDSTR